MTDYSEHLVIIQRATTELNWLLPDCKLGPAMEKAILIEQAARAIVEYCKRHKARLQYVAEGHTNMQTLTDVVGTDKCKAVPIIYAHIAHADHDEF